jgi:hypothetical protein
VYKQHLFIIADGSCIPNDISALFEKKPHGKATLL